MITTLGNQSWSPDLCSGNAEFIETNGVVYVVSQVRADNTFAVMKSDPVPPAPGPGYSFTEVAKYTFPYKVTSFDPVLAVDSNNLLHIVGVADNPNSRDVDLLKFSLDLTASTPVITYPQNSDGSILPLVTASYVRDAYDICIIDNNNPFIVAAVTNPNIPAFVNKHVLLGIELTTGDAILSTVQLDSSTVRGGTTFGAVSLVSPDGVTVEVYYESYPKTITFKDVSYNVNCLRRLPAFVSGEVQAVGASPVTVSGATTFLYDQGVIDVTTGLPMTRVTTVPLSGQYSVVAGVYTFNVAEQNKDVQISYAMGPLTWDVAGVNPPLYSFVGSMTDNRMTVIAKGSERYVSQVFFNTMTHINAFIGSLLLGRYDGTAWQWHITPGSLVGGSLLQATLSVSATQGAHVAYISQPVYPRKGGWDATKTYAVNDSVLFNKLEYVASTAIPKGAANPGSNSNWTLAPTAWPLHVAAVNLQGLTIADIPGPTLTFSWLRGAKSVLDDLSLWGVVGECLQGTTVTPVFVSSYNVPPVAHLSPSSATAYRRIPLQLSAAQTFDGDSDSIQYVWVNNSQNPYVSFNGTGDIVSLNVDPRIGGDQQNFNVAVIAFDQTNGVSDHPPLTILGVVISTVNAVQTLTVHTYTQPQLVVGQRVLLYSLTYSTELNVEVVTVTGVGSFNFTANLDINAGYADTTLTFETGYAVAEFDLTGQKGQFALCSVNVPFNAPPEIDFTTDAITGDYVVLPIAATRNQTVTINPSISGVSDTDDSDTYAWTQTGGTTVATTGTAFPSLVLNTKGANVLGETLTFNLIASDGVNPSASASVGITVAPYDTTHEDTLILSTSSWAGNISQRNTTQIWTPLAQLSEIVNGTFVAFKSDLASVKRSTVLNGPDRELFISPDSVIVYDAGSSTARILYTPQHTKIVDAVHTEADSTLVIDDAGFLYRYSTAPMIVTDSPDTTINLSSLTSFTFRQVFSTVVFGNARIIVLWGAAGCFLLQVSSDMSVLDSMELTTASGFMYGANDAQWIRTSNVESLKTGKILIGSTTAMSSLISSVNISNSLLTVKGSNDFVVGQKITFTDVEVATFLNGVTVTLLYADSGQFTASHGHADYPTTLDSGTASGVGSCFETLIDLSLGEIVGTWDSSKLRNQTVTDGEILFESGSGYFGAPIAPVITSVQPDGSGGYLITWTQVRSDLVSGYWVQASRSYDSIEWSDWVTITGTRSGAVTSISVPLFSGFSYQFRVQATSLDGLSPYSNIYRMTVLPLSSSFDDGTFLTMNTQIVDDGGLIAPNNDSTLDDGGF